MTRWPTHWWKKQGLSAFLQNMRNFNTKSRTRFAYKRSCRRWSSFRVRVPLLGWKFHVRSCCNRGKLNQDKLLENNRIWGKKKKKAAVAVETRQWNPPTFLPPQASTALRQHFAHQRDTSQRHKAGGLLLFQVLWFLPQSSVPKSIAVLGPSQHEVKRAAQPLRQLQRCAHPSASFLQVTDHTALQFLPSRLLLGYSRGLN